MKDMFIFYYDLHDYELDFQPADIYDFEFWMTVNVGDGTAGAYYQVHICTPMSINGIPEKQGCFMVDQWEGFPRLIAKMNGFIDKVQENPDSADPYVRLGKHWVWEYEGM